MRITCKARTLTVSIQPRRPIGSSGWCIKCETEILAMKNSHFGYSLAAYEFESDCKIPQK
jgi:hypothetical protein